MDETCNPIREDPKSTPDGMVNYIQLHYIFKNFTVAGIKHVFRITRSFTQKFDKIANKWPATTISK